MFTQSCFIRKNTEGLRLALDLLGYKPMQSIIRNREDMLFVKDGYFMNNFPYDTTQSDKAIDCSNNESLFLALATLRDDTDKNQWFVYDNTDYADEQEKEITYFICKQDSIKDEMCINSMYADCHKATVQELIEHFKDK